MAMKNDGNATPPAEFRNRVTPARWLLGRPLKTIPRLLVWPFCLVWTIGSTLAQSELITNGDFASGASGWSLMGDFYAAASFTNARSTPGCARASRPDGAPGNNLYGVLRQTLTLPTNATSVTLTFWLSITTQETGAAPADILGVFVLDASGGIVETKATFSNLDAKPEYVQKTIDLTAYQGRTIGIKYLATTDGARPTTFSIDDVSVRATTAPAPSATTAARPAATLPSAPPPATAPTPAPLFSIERTSIIPPPPVVAGPPTRTLTGKGDWIHRIDLAMSAMGVETVESLMDFEKARGVEWLVVKCADADNHAGWRSLQFNSDLISKGRAAGLKIYGYHFIFGGNRPANYPNPSSVPGEIQAALESLSLQPDGLVIDWEGEFEGLGEAAGIAAAEEYCRAIRAHYPNTLLAHAPIWKPSVHRPNTYKMFNKYCDVVMPQAYGSQHASRTETWINPVRPSQMVALMNNDWLNVTASWPAECLKPIAPVIWGATPTTSAEISEFVSNLRALPRPASPGGYRAVSFWSAQHHTTDIWNGIAAASLGVASPEPIPVVISTAPAGQPITVDGIGYLATPQTFHWAPGSPHRVSSPPASWSSDSPSSTTITIRQQRPATITIRLDGEISAPRAGLP